MRDVDERAIDRGGRRIAVDVRAGEEPVIVFAAGGGCTGLDWCAVFDELPEWRLLAYDRAGLGRSDSGSEPSTAVSALDDLGAVVESGHATGGAVLVGHSLGGSLVRAFAAVHPELVRALVLVDPRPELIDARLPWMIERTRSANARDLRRLQQLARTGIPSRVTRFVPLRSPRNLTPALRRRRGSLMLSYRHLTTDELILARGLDTRLGAADPAHVPPLWLITHDPAHGDLLPADPESDEEREMLETVWTELQTALVESVPAGRMVVATGAGHLIPLACPRLVAATIKDAVASTSIT